MRREKRQEGRRCFGFPAIQTKYLASARLINMTTGLIAAGPWNRLTPSLRTKLVNRRKAAGGRQRELGDRASVGIPRKLNSKPGDIA